MHGGHGDTPAVSVADPIWHTDWHRCWHDSSRSHFFWQTPCFVALIGNSIPARALVLTSPAVSLSVSAMRTEHLRRHVWPHGSSAPHSRLQLPIAAPQITFTTWPHASTWRSTCALHATFCGFFASQHLAFSYTWPHDKVIDPTTTSHLPQSSPQGFEHAWPHQSWGANTVACSKSWRATLDPCGKACGSRGRTGAVAARTAADTLRSAPASGNRDLLDHAMVVRVFLTVDRQTVAEAAILDHFLENRRP